MEDLKEYFEGHMKDSITGELYHGSPKRMDVILPHTASHGRPYVYASPDYLFSLCYAGLQWNDFEINQSYYNGELYLTEIQRGQFREKLQRPGYVYHLNKDDFKKLPNSADAEFVSEQAVSPLAVDEIPNVYRRLVSKGVHLYEYPNLPPFIDDREGYIISKAEDLYVQDNPEMYQYLVKTFPGIVAKALKDYVDEYGKESVSEIDTLNTYTDNEEGTVKQESVISDAADISGENKSDSDIFIEKKKGSSEKLYFVSESSDWDDGRMMPRIPDNFMTRNGYEDNTTPRVCFSTSIDGCLRALSMNLAGKEFYVYTPDSDGIYDVITPTVKQVPDVKLTHERWITTPVDTVLIGKIKVIKDAGGPPLEYKYGDKTASLYDWEWKWISKRDGSVTKESAGDEIPKVYFTKDITPESLIRLYYKISAGKNLSGNVMVKISTGEPGGHNFLQPSLIGPLVNVVHGTICDANTAYAGLRSTTESHYQVMKDHGFTDIAPVDVLDGDGEIEIPVNNGYHLKTLPVGSHNSNYGTFLILTHFKGHAMAGFGGAMKNIAIGMASARGKAIVHSAGKSETEVMGHPQQPFLQSMVDSVKASIDYGGRENFLYINVANNLSVDCDCDAHPADPTMKDIGVFASTDPLAIDQACIDAVDRAADNKDLVARIKRQDGRNILKYAEDAGIGSRKYELIDLDKEENSNESVMEDMDALLGSMFEEYSYPPHREEPMDTTPEQTVPSEHSFLRDDEDEEKPKPGFGSSIKTEGVVISKDDTVIGLDRWKPEKGKNILFITGLSGSGKSTLAEEYETKYHAHMFEIDGLEHRYDSSGTAKVLQKVREKCPEYDEYFKDRSQKAADNIDVLWKAADVALDVMKDDYKTLYIVEGVQLYDGFYSDDALKGKPLIIKNTSHLTSIIRALKRTSETDEKSFAKAIKENLPEILSYHRKSYKPFKKFKEKFAKESVSELDDLFNDAIRSFSITQESSDSPIMQIDPDDIRNQFTTELTTVSELDANHETKEKKSLSSFKQVVCDEGEFDKWKQKFSEFRHVRMSDRCMFTFWMDNDEDLVAYVNIEEKDDHYVIQALEVSKKYQGSGLGSQLLKYAEKNHANMLWVNPANKVAVEMYKKAGWHYGENKNRGKLQPMYKESVLIENAEDESIGFLKVKGDTLEIHRKVSENPNDPVGKEAHDLSFYLDGKKIADISISAVDSDRAFLYNFEVKKDYRGKGYGTAILKYVLKNYSVNELTVNKNNTRAIDLYKRFGFKVGKEFKEDGKTRVDMKINMNEAAGVMEFLPYVGVKKDPPPDTDYPGSPFKALEESYETVFEFKNEEAGECVSVMETPFAPESVFLKVDEYHYPDIIHELVEDVITDIENGSEDYAEKANLVWYITGEDAEPLCAVAEDVGFVPIPSIDPTRNDIFTYAMDIHEFTPEKTQYATEAVDVTTIFRADEDYIYLNAPYCEFYIPTEYFAMGKKFAEDFTDKIHTIGLFNIGIFEDDKLVDVKVFNVPIYLDIMVYDYDVRMIDVGSGTPVECRVYKYYQDSIICRSFIAENSGVAQTFLQLIISGSMPGTIPYSQCLSVWRKNLELSGVNLGVSSAIMEMILAVMYRDAKDPSKKYCIRYGSSEDSSEFDYMSASIRQICQYNSTFTGIIYEDIDSMITSAINRNRNGKEEGETPMEKIIKM